MNKALVLYAVIWALSIVLFFITKSWVCFGIPHIFFILNEMLYVYKGVDLVPSADRTALFYDLASWYTHFAGTDPNYTEGYYPDDDYSISGREAENNKFAKFLQLLGAKTGDTILNLGSGTCGFEKYCKQRGIKMVATSLSGHQIDHCKEHGIEGYIHDYRVFNPEFEGRFDHITFMGSCEHMYSGSVFDHASFVAKNKTLQETFEILKRYLKPNGRIVFTELHANPVYTKTFGMYILERAYGGTPSLDVPKLNAASAASNAGFKVMFTRDATKDYYMATVLNKKHFGTPMKPWYYASAGLILLSLIYPPAILIWIYGVFGYWMWMFDGRLHFVFWKRYSLAAREKRPFTLWWHVFENSTVDQGLLHFSAIS
jgi:cyclopropane fatty-acyl-phospholipid synthase-like methyltransferase